jgi:translation elongation factor EF-Ts
LLEQTFVKDSGKTVTDVLKEMSAANGSTVDVVQFRRYFLGDDASKN